MIPILPPDSAAASVVDQPGAAADTGIVCVAGLKEHRGVFSKMLDQLAASGNRGSLAASLLLFRSQTLAAQNKSAEALADAEQALPVARAAQGDHRYSHFTGQVWLALAKYQHQGRRHAQARASAANALANLEATLNADHRLIREGRELATQLDLLRVD